MNMFEQIIASNFTQREADNAIIRHHTAVETQFRSQVEAFAAIVGDSAEITERFLNGECDR